MNLSVVIPLYNKEKYIGRTIESVLGQMVPPEEIVVVDDGSTDHSVSEVLRFKDNRVRLIHQQNSGVGATRNRGVAEAKHDLVAFLDADDEWKPDFLIHIQRLYNNFPDCGAYATTYEIINPDGSRSYPFLMGTPPAPWIGIIPNLFKMLQYSAPFFPSSIAIPKNVYRALNGFPVGIPIGEDRMMWVRLGIKYPIAFSPSRQVHYHRDAENHASSGQIERDPIVSNLIDGMLKNHEVPLALIEDLRDYSASLKIQRVYHLVISNHAKEARELLDLMGPNHKYKNQWLYWRFLTLAPYSLINFIRAVLKNRKI